MRHQSVCLWDNTRIPLFWRVRPPNWFWPVELHLKAIKHLTVLSYKSLRVRFSGHLCLRDCFICADKIRFLLLRIARQTQYLPYGFSCWFLGWLNKWASVTRLPGYPRLETRHRNSLERRYSFPILCISRCSIFARKDRVTDRAFWLSSGSSPCLFVYLHNTLHAKVKMICNLLKCDLPSCLLVNRMPHEQHKLLAWSQPQCP